MYVHVDVDVRMRFVPITVTKFSRLMRYSCCNSELSFFSAKLWFDTSKWPSTEWMSLWHWFETHIHWIISINNRTFCIKTKTSFSIRWIYSSKTNNWESRISEIMWWLSECKRTSALSYIKPLGVMSYLIVFSKVERCCTVWDFGRRKI